MKHTNLKWFSGLAVLTLAIAPGFAQAATIYDLRDDWSDISNPMGAWTLYKNANRDPFTVNLDWFANQKAWADAPFPQPTHVPFWLKSSGSDLSRLGIIVPEGTVIAHGAEFDRTGTNTTGVRWTSSENGTINIDGSVWDVSGFNRTMEWQLILNGTLLSEGTIVSDGSSTALNPFFFSNGTGGLAALTQNIQKNDTLDLNLVSLSQGGNLGDWMGIDIKVGFEPSPIPEPLTILGTATALGFGALFKRKNTLNKEAKELEFNNYRKFILEDLEY